MGLLAEKILSARKQRGLSAYELARQVGITRSYMSEVENGKAIPSEDVVRNLANVLGEQIETLQALADADAIGPERAEAVATVVEHEYGPIVAYAFQLEGEDSYWSWDFSGGRILLLFTSEDTASAFAHADRSLRL